jgi:hypothetical protein
MNTLGTAGVHRVFVALSSALTAIAALFAATDTSALGLDSQQTAIIAFALALGNIVATALRQAYDS